MAVLAFARRVHDRILGIAPWIQHAVALATRVALGWVFFESGRGKFGNLEGVTAYFTDLGIPLPALQAPFVAAVETVCGLVLILGLGTRFAALMLAGTMAVALITEFRGYWGADHSWSDLFGLAEFVYLLGFGWLVVQGAGVVSLDRLALVWLRRSQGSDPAVAEPR